MLEYRVTMRGLRCVSAFVCIWTMFALFTSACTKRCRPGASLVDGVCRTATTGMGVPGAAVPAAADAHTSQSAAPATASSMVQPPGGVNSGTRPETTDGLVAGSSGTVPPNQTATVAGAGGSAPNAPTGSDGVSTGASCQAGENSCDGIVKLQCSASGEWEPSVECPFVCVMGTCSGECRPGSKQCSANSVQSCTEEGVWVDAEMCPNVCAEGECAGQCAPGARQCSGASAEHCGDDGAWVVDQACPYVCSDGACVGECLPNSVRCSSLTPETCDAQGAWQPGQACRYICDEGRCTGSCRPGETRCSGPTEELCSEAGDWVQQEIRIGACNVRCIPGTESCDGTTTTPTRCSASGQIERQPISPPKCNAVCQPNTRGCTTDRRATQCSSDGRRETVGELSVDCGADCTRPGMQGECSGINTVMTCGSDGMWRPGTARAGTCVCDPTERLVGCALASDMDVPCRTGGTSGCIRQSPQTGNARLLRCGSDWRWETTQTCPSCFLCAASSPDRQSKLGSACSFSGGNVQCISNRECPLLDGSCALPEP